MKSQTYMRSATNSTRQLMDARTERLTNPDLA
jgi:hypothetical protein